MTPTQIKRLFSNGSNRKLGESSWWLVQKKIDFNSLSWRSSCQLSINRLVSIRLHWNATIDGPLQSVLLVHRQQFESWPRCSHSIANRARSSTNRLSASLLLLCRYRHEARAMIIEAWMLVIVRYYLAPSDWGDEFCLENSSIGSYCSRAWAS